MRRLFLADVHANLPAFEAVIEHAGAVDEVFFLGDVVGCGSRPAECADLLRAVGARSICGNHDTAVLASAGEEGFPRAGNWDHWSLAQLDEAQRHFLACLPARADVHSCGRATRLIHRSPADHYLHPDMPDAQVEAYFRPVPGEAVYCGHSHRAMDRVVGGRRLVCLPPVGQPRNRDPRAGYAVEADGELHFAFVEYDVEAMLGDLERIGLDHALRVRWEQFLGRAWDPQWSRDYVPGVPEPPPDTQGREQRAWRATS